MIGEARTISNPVYILEDSVIFESLLDIGVRVAEAIGGDVVRDDVGNGVGDDVGDGVEINIFCYLVNSNF